MADEQDRAERLDDEKFDDLDEPEPPVALLDDADVGEEDEEPAPDYYGAGVPAEEAAMRIDEA